MKRGLKNWRKQKGITLIALVITIIVLLILAGISIATLTGDNGILTKAQIAKEKSKKAEVEEKIQIEAMSSYDNNGEFQKEEFKKRIEKIGGSIVSENENEIVVQLEGYKVTLDIKTGKIKSTIKEGEKDEREVIPEVEVTKALNGEEVTITVKVTNEVETVKSIIVTNRENGEKQEAEIREKEGAVEVTTDGHYKIEVTTITNGKESKVEKEIEVTEIEIEFSTAYGKIEVIWIGKDNEPIEEPLAPTGMEGMTKVYWEGDTEIRDDGKSGFDENKWYKYIAKTGNGDNTESKWANAINKTDEKSYFVWIPRYAYRIMYYADSAYTKLSGYCDGRGFVDVNGNVITKEVDGEPIKLELDEGIKTTEKDGISYIVHPAFMDNKENNYNNGGWTEDLSGIWVAKYEMSKEVNGVHQDTTTDSGDGDNNGNVVTDDELKIKAVSVPGVSSWRYINIGNCYTNGQNYDKGKESHLMKNSEWGAVAYLTHSQYGRNGVEITQNTDPGFFTGGETGATATFNELQSSTGNSYGIYDLSGCGYEYVALYDQAATSTDLATYGKSFAKKGGTSNEYSTTYTNGTSIYSGNKIYKVGKIGDATKEVYTGSSYYGWFTDYSYFVGSNGTFLDRGGFCRNGNAGMFYSGCSNGSTLSQRRQFLACGFDWSLGMVFEEKS